MEQLAVGSAVLYCGDERLVSPWFPEADALVCDPPYGINVAAMTGRSRNRWNTHRRSVEYSFAIAGDDRPFDTAPFLAWPRVVLFGGNHFGSRLPDASCWLVWDKRDGSSSDHQADCELAWSNLPGPARLYSHKWRGMIRAGEENLSRGGLRVHPMQKPVALMAWVLQQCRLPAGALVLDPFMGSGSLGVAAVRLGLRYVGVEIDPQHFAVACSRIADAARQPSLLEGGAGPEPAQEGLCL